MPAGAMNCAEWAMGFDPLHDGPSCLSSAIPKGQSPKPCSTPENRIGLRRSSQRWLQLSEPLAAECRRSAWSWFDEFTAMGQAVVSASCVRQL
jgi:hypothetical protein